MPLIRELSHGFSKLSHQERMQRLLQMGIQKNDLDILSKESSLSSFLAGQLIENNVGSFPVPLGLALNFVIDSKDYIIPMAVEESSIIAAASKTAKWIAEEGEITTRQIGQLGVGQIQFPCIRDFVPFQAKIEEAKAQLIEVGNQAAAKIVSRGGGLREIVCRQLARGDGQYMGIVHVLMDTCDAMGANTITQVCEAMRPHLEELTQEKVGMCILSNLCDTKLTEAQVVIRNIDPALGHAITEGSLFAQLDPYRAATSNKGVMNGIDAVLLATGNDWRAVEAALHAYAAHTGHYTSITQWKMNGPHLEGILRAPIVVGIVGGVTRLHPVAKISLKLLNVSSAAELSRVLAAVGLVQNLAALRALVTEGLTKGHMRLHLSNLAIEAGAIDHELARLKAMLKERLDKLGRISSSDAIELLQELRKQNN